MGQKIHSVYAIIKNNRVEKKKLTEDLKIEEADE